MIGFKEKTINRRRSYHHQLRRVKNFFSTGRVSPELPRSLMRFSEPKNAPEVSTPGSTCQVFFYLSIGAHRNAVFRHPTGVRLIKRVSEGGSLPSQPRPPESPAAKPLLTGLRDWFRIPGFESAWGCHEHAAGLQRRL